MARLARASWARPARRKSEIIPLPSGGVFAEAVLGRFNAAEKIDLTRFWNWQDSPIPITAPEIAPVQAGSRARSDEIRPGQLSAPVVTIQNPTALPDPTGVAAILGAIQQGNMFRDMSGLAQTAALAQAGVQASAQGATAAGQQAAATLATVMANNTERMRIAAQLLAGTPAFGGGQQPPGKGTVSERGGELNAAQEIGNQIDQSAGDGDTVAGSSEPTAGQKFRVAAFHHQFASSGSGSAGGTSSPPANIYVAPRSNSGGPPPADSVVRIKVAFQFLVDGQVVPMARADQMVDITSSGGHQAWGRPFFVTLGGNIDHPALSELPSPPLWNDQTFEYVVTTGVKFVPIVGTTPTINTGPPKAFYSNKIDMPKTGMVQVTVRAERVTRVFVINETNRTRAFLEARKRLVLNTGISEAMLEHFTAPQTPTNGQFTVAISYFTGNLDVVDISKVKRSSATAHP